MNKLVPSIVALALVVAVPASAATFGATESFQLEFPIAPDGTVVVDNPFGNVDVIGVDGLQAIVLTAQRTVRGQDQTAIAEGRDQTALVYDGDVHSRLIQTRVPLLHSQRWTSVVNYTLRVPRGVQLKIVSNSSERIRVSSLTNAISIKNWTGNIVVDNVTGPVFADSLNGDILFELNSRPGSNLQLTTVNGRIQLVVPPDSAFRWLATTIKGDFFSTLPVGGRFNGTKYVAVVNRAQAGPTISTTSMMGNVYILRPGSRPEQAQSARATAREAEGGVAAGTSPLLAQTFQRASYEGDFVYNTSIGNVSIGQVRGAARVATKAGEVHLGIVQGQCDITSLGGPLTLGDVFGPLSARTNAGDVLINVARRGAFVTTGGGMIKVLLSNGPTNLRSEGGDIVVRQASGPITAETRSGDVTITMDARVRESAVDLKTAQGNVVLNVRPTFAADIEAIVVTSDADSNPIHSDFPGLTIHRETVGSKTRIRAVGKINGGGARVVLYAEDGDIHLNADTSDNIATAR